MTATFTFVVVIIVIALIFDYSNGFHDAANSIATVVSTRVLSPGIAVVWAAFFNFIAFAIYGTRVAKPIGDGVNMTLIAPDDRLYVLLAALIGAVAWNLITWYLGLPTSSSHALLGGYAGAGIAAYGGVAGLLKMEVWTKVLIFIVLSPLIGLTLGLAMMVAVYWIFRRWSPHRVDRLFRSGQLLSAAAFSLGHGGNDAQKTMGIIAALLVGSGYLQLKENGDLPVPLWVVLAAHAAIALGTLSGGWRIVKARGCPQPLPATTLSSASAAVRDPPARYGWGHAEGDVAEGGGVGIPAAAGDRQPDRPAGRGPVHRRPHPRRGRACDPEA